MSEPIKLKQAGDKHTMTVQSCAELPFGKYKEYEFVGRDGSVVRVPKAATERQFGRLSLTTESVVGRRVTLKRDASSDPAKPFWGIYLEESGAENGTGGAASAAKPGTGTLPTHTTTGTTQPRPATRQDVERTFDVEIPEKKPTGYALYRAITEKVLADMPGLYEKAGITLDAEAAAAIVATVFIQASRNGQ